MVGPFRHLTNPTLVFGRGRIAEVPSLLNGAKKVLIVTGRHFSESTSCAALEQALSAAGVDYVRERIGGEPSPEMVDPLAARAREAGAETLVAIGGGSVLDATKAAAAMMRQDGSVFDYLEGVGSRTPTGETAPMIALPTTAGTGSEATKNAVISRRGDGGFKKSLRHDAFIPRVALIDPELALGCPPEVTLACGMDAFSQLLESFISTGATPLTDALARDGLYRFARGSRLMSEGLYGTEEELDCRENLALAAYSSGLTLANAGLGTVHGLAGPLGAVCDVPHGAACGLMAPPVFRHLVEKLRDRRNSDVLEKLAWTGMVLDRGVDGSGPVPREDDVDRLLDILETRAADLPRLSNWGLSEDMLDTVVAGSGNKNFPVSLSAEEQKAVLAEVL